MKLLQNSTVRKKIIGIVLLISFISISLTLLLIVFYKSRTDRLQFADEVKQYAELVGEQCREALSDRDRESLEKGLSVFQSVPNITDSVILGPDNKKLASYSHSGEALIPSNLEQINKFEFRDNYLHVILPITDEKQIYGKIFVRASVAELKSKFKFFIITTLFLWGLMLLFVYFLARNFQGIISKPLSNLITATKNISGSGEAGVRIKKKKKNEFLILRDRLRYLLNLENLHEMRTDEIDKAKKEVKELDRIGKEYKERFENLACGIFIFEAVDEGENFIIKDLNITGEKLERIHRSDLIGKKITDVYPEVRNSGLLEALKNVWENDTEKHISYGKLKDEDKRWREFSISRLPSEEIMALFRDVTDKKAEQEARQKEMDEQKKKFQVELKQNKEMVFSKLEKGVKVWALNNEMEDLFSATEMVLRDPLESINKFSKSFLQNYADKVDDEGKDQLIKIRAASHRMIQMIKEFNRMAELSFGQFKLEPVNLSEMVKERSVKLKEANPGRKAEFVVQKGVIATGDPRMLRIVIDNLLTNAWIYSSRKTSIKIEFGVKQNKNVREYYIKDNGIGFKMTDIDEMFRPFKRLNRDEVIPGLEWAWLWLDGLFISTAVLSVQRENPEKERCFILHSGFECHKP